MLKLTIYTLDGDNHTVTVEPKDGSTPDQAAEELFDQIHGVVWFQCIDSATGKRFACNVEHVCFIRVNQT